MINFPAYQAFAWTVFSFWSLFSLDLYVNTSYLIRSNALYPLFNSWWWNCTSFSHVQTNSWLVHNLKTGAYWSGGCMYVIACVNAVINQKKIEPMLLIKPSLYSLSSHFIDWPLHIHSYKKWVKQKWWLDHVKGWRDLKVFRALKIHNVFWFTTDR
jgi:hypothetical protein